MKLKVFLISLVSLLIVCCSNGSDHIPNSITTTNKSVLENSDTLSLLDSLIMTIDDNSDILHSDYTPSVHQLSTMGIPALDAITPLLSSADEMTRLHA